MAIQFIYLGTVPNDGTGTPLRDGGQIINDNFAIVAITGSNIFRGDQEITGSVTITGSLYLPSLQSSESLSNVLAIDTNTGLVYYKSSSGGSGHEIVDENDTVYPQESQLKFVRLLVSSSSGQTVITRPGDTSMEEILPSNPVQGDEWTSPNTFKTYKYYGVAWVELPSGVSSTSGSSVSSSYADYALSSSYAITASYALNSTGGTTTGSFTGSFTGSLLGTASYSLTTKSSGSNYWIQYSRDGVLGATSTLYYDYDKLNLVAAPITLIGGDVDWNNNAIFGEGHTIYTLPSGGGSVTDTAVFGWAHEIGDGVGYFGGSTGLTYGAFNKNYGVGAFVGGQRARALSGSGGGAGGGFVVALNAFDDPTPYVTIAPRGINISTNTTAQTEGHGALGIYSAIIGGRDHNIPTSSARSAIIGGSGIKADENTPDTVYLPNLRVSGSAVIKGDLIVSGSISGSINSASYASSSLSASYAITSSYSFNTISASFASTASYVNPLRQEVIVSGSIIVSGSSGSSAVVIRGSGSALPVFSVQGSQGELFSIIDSLSGSLFSVNDISGLPVLEAFSDNTILMGSYQAPALFTTVRFISSVGSNQIYTNIPTASYDGMFIDYTITSASNMRAGQIMAIRSASSVNYTETATTDFGSTAGVNFMVRVSGSEMAFTGSFTTANWVVKAIIRGI